MARSAATQLALLCADHHVDPEVQRLWLRAQIARQVRPKLAVAPPADPDRLLKLGIC